MLGRRRIFIDRARRSSPHLVARLRPRRQRGRADRRARRAGRRRRADEPRDALDHHRDLPAAAARDGDRDLGRASRRSRSRSARSSAACSPSTSTGAGSSSSTSRSASLGIVAAFALHRRVAGHLGRAASRPAGPRHVRGRPVRADLRADRGEQATAGRRRASSSLFALRGRLARRLRRCSSAVSGCRCSTCRCSATGTFAGANAVMLLVGLAMFGVFFFVSLYMQNILGYSADPGGRELPADDRADHPGRAAGREALRPASGRAGSWPPAWSLLAVSLLLFATLEADSTFWALLPGVCWSAASAWRSRWRRRLRRRWARSRRQGRRRLGRDEQHAAGRRLDRHRRDGRDRRGARSRDRARPPGRSSTASPPRSSWRRRSPSQARWSRP